MFLCTASKVDLSEIGQVVDPAFFVYSTLTSDGGFITGKLDKQNKDIVFQIDLLLDYDAQLVSVPTLFSNKQPTILAKTMIENYESFQKKFSFLKVQYGVAYIEAEEKDFMVLFFHEGSPLSELEKQVVEAKEEVEIHYENRIINFKIKKKKVVKLIMTEEERKFLRTYGAFIEKNPLASLQLVEKDKSILFFDLKGQKRPISDLEKLLKISFFGFLFKYFY
jgi:hypothetical protein